MFPSKFIAATLMFCAASAGAQTYPDRPLKVIVPFAAGGGTDAFGRAVCDVLSAQLKQTCIVENKAGAGTAIGNAMVSKSPPDGYTLLLTTSAFAIVPVISKSPGYEGVDSFSAVAMLGVTPNVILVRSDSRFKTLGDFLSAAKAKPGHVPYGSSGVGSTTHLTGELLANDAKLDIPHVGYRGAGPLITDLIGGQLEVAISSLTSAMPTISGGRVRPLAVSTAERTPKLPDTPTVAESGVPGFDVPVWYGLFVPRATPPAIVETLNKALAGLPQDPKFVDWAGREGVVPMHSTPKDAEARVRADEKRWRELAKHKDIRVD